MLKKSYYAISTEVGTPNGKNKTIAFSTRTSEAIVLENDVVNLLNSNIELIPKETLDLLIEKKFVVPEDEDELDTIIKENNNASASETLLYEVIQPSAMCQLGCDYCGQHHEKVNTSTSISEKIISRISKKLEDSNGKFKALKIGWFGGEPLMALQEIRSMTRAFKEICSQYNIGYSAKIVTNGLSLKEKIFVELAKDLNITSIEITLDGTEEFHDARRHTKDGGKSYKLILKNLLSIVNRVDFFDLKCSISVRCNVDKRNYLGVTPLIQELASLGLQNKISFFYVASVYSWGNDAHLKSFSKEEFAELEIDWLIEMFKNGFQPFLFPGRVRSVCLAVSPNSDMYDAYGNVFNCTEVSYVPIYNNSDYLLGNLKKPEQVSSRRKHSDWNEQIRNNDFQCHSCKMLPVCGGGCPKQWHEGRAACPTPKFNIKERLLLSYIHVKKGVKELTELAQV